MLVIEGKQNAWLSDSFLLSVNKHTNLDNMEKLLQFYKLNHIISSHVPFIPMTFAGFE